MKKRLVFVISILLLTSGISFSQGMYTNLLLFKAIIENNFTDFQTTLTQGADVNARDNRGFTPLSYAVSMHSIDERIPKILISRGANVNSRTPGNNTALILAAAHGRSNMVKLLLSNRAEINAQNSLGATALHISVWQNQIEIIRILVEHGANIKIRNLHGETALDVASGRGFSEAYQILSNAQNR